MDTNAWLAAAAEELAVLTQATNLDESDVWRLAVLAARLLGSPDAPAPSSAALSILARETARLAHPTGPELLSQLATAISGDEDPGGPLFDALLDIDDVCTVAATFGPLEDAPELARRAEALLSVWPNRTLGLAGFASMRRSTLRPGALQDALWAAVERAPAEVLADALPTLGSARSSTIRTPARTRQVRPAARPHHWYGKVPAAVVRAAAWTPGVVLELETSGGRMWLEESGGRLQLEARIEPGDLVSVEIVGGVDNAVLLTEPVSGELRGRTFYADLGPAVGPGSRAQDWIRRSGAATEEVTIRLRVSGG